MADFEIELGIPVPEARADYPRRASLATLALRELSAAPVGASVLLPASDLEDRWRINSLAQKVFGSGGYRLRVQPGGGVRVWKLAERGE